MTDTKLYLPNLTRKSIDELDRDFRAKDAFSEVEREVGSKTKLQRYERPIENLFLFYYSPEDVFYRNGLFNELLDNTDFRKKFDVVYHGIPKSRLPSEIKTEGEWGTERSEASLRSDLYLINQYLNFPKALEAMAELPGTAEAIQDLRKFGIEARRSLDNYIKIIPALQVKPLIKGKGELDIEWGNHCLDQIMPYYELIRRARGIYLDMRTYLASCIPYELKYEGKRIPSCAPVFLDPERREGTILRAYHPAEFKYGKDKRGRTIVTELNVPNDIRWGKEARNTFVNGANSQGKSFYLRTIALNVQMVMAGLRPFADYCELSLPRKLFSCLDMGDSLGEGHFMTGGNKVLKMTENATLQDLIFLDETGAGTEPAAEREIAKGISDALIEIGFTSWNVTHDRGAWEGYTEKEGVRFLRVADLDDSERKYQVWPGIAQGGYAMKIAREKCIDPESVREKLKVRSLIRG
ncbi:MAG: hypothetical protein WCV90_05965 [Candidatus Woesearchaeota archaeon]